MRFMQRYGRQQMYRVDLIVRQNLIQISGATAYVELISDPL